MLDLSNSDVASAVVFLKPKSVPFFTLKTIGVELSISSDSELSRSVGPAPSSTTVLGSSSDLRLSFTVVDDVHHPLLEHSLDLSEKQMAMRKRDASLIL